MEGTNKEKKLLGITNNYQGRVLRFYPKGFGGLSLILLQAYGFPIKDFTESDCVARLLEMYQELTKG